MAYEERIMSARRRLWNHLAFVAALLRVNLAGGLARPVFAVTSAAMMLANNLILSLLWVIYFADFSSLRGWGLQDLALLLGIVAWAFGLTVFLAGGLRDLANTIADGGLDVHLGRPRHPLPGLLLSRPIPSGLGDMASAFLFWFWLGRAGIGDLPLLLAVSTAAAVVLGATLVITQCLPFWLTGSAALSEELFNMLLVIVFYPQNAYGFLVRLVLFTILTAAYVGLLPVEAVRNHDFLQALGVLAAAVGYGALAVWVFERGLRRYTSGNRILELR
jgi:ABC-2 type transport system permease protein